MDQEKAKKTGSKLAIKTIIIVIVVLLAYWAAIAINSNGIDNLFSGLGIGEFMNVILGIIIILLISYYFGKIAGKQILIKGNNAILVGILAGLSIIIAATFLIGWLLFFQEGIHEFGTSNRNPLLTYIFTPVFAFTAFGFIPVLIVGTIYGILIKKHKIKENT